MARDIESLQLQMTADIRRFAKSMDKMRETADRRLNEVERKAMQSDRRLSRIMGRTGENMTRSFQDGLRGLAPALAAAFSVQQIIRYADGFTALQNRLAVTGLAGAELARVQDHLFAASTRNGVEVGALSELYGRLALSTGELGVGQADLLKLTDGVTAALRVQGTSTQAASGALLQLAQALGSGTVRAEEFNSLIEGTPVIVQAAANGMGVSVAALRSSILEGEVTSRQFFDALMTGFPEIERQAETATLTIGQSFTALSNKLMEYIGVTDESLGATDRMAQAIMLLAENVDVVVTAAGVAVVIVGTRLVVAQTAAAAAASAHAAAQITLLAAISGTSRAALAGTVALRALGTAALFFVTNPIGIAITAIAVAIGFLAVTTNEAVDATEDFVRSNDALKTATDAYTEAANAAAIATGREAVAARAAAAEKRELAAAARDAARSKLAEAQATIALIGAEARRRIELEQFNFRGDRAGTTAPISGPDRQRVAEARANVAASQAAIAAASAAIDEADATLSRAAAAAAAGGAAGGGARGSTRSGPSAAELAAQAEFEARTAEKLKAEQLGELARQEAIDAAIKAKQESEAAYALASEQAANTAQDQLGYQIELARLSGNTQLLEALERQRWLNERINELMSDRFGLTEAEATTQANREDRELAAAAEGATAARAIVDILRSDNIWEEAGRRFQDAAWDGVEQIFAEIIKQFSLSRAASGGGGGGGFDFGAILTSFFGAGGKKAVGGRVLKGYPKLIGERQAEVFVPDVNGTIMPNVSAAMNRAGQAKVGRSIVEHRVTVVPEAESFIRLSAETAAPMVEQGSKAAFNGARQQTPTDLARGGRYRLGRRG